MNENMCKMHGPKDDFYDDVKDQIALKTTDPSKFDAQMNALKVHLNKIQGTPHKFSEYENFIKILKNLDCKACLTKEYKADIKDIEKRYKKMFAEYENV